MRVDVHHHIVLQRDDPVVTLILAKLAGIANRQEITMTDISKLQTDVAALTGAVTAVVSDLQNERQQNKTLQDQVTALQAQIAAGGSVNQSDIDALDTSVASAVTTLTGQVSQDQTTGITTDAPKT